MHASRLLGDLSRGLFAILLTLSLGLAATAHGAVEVTNLGPLTYVRNPGRPTVYTTSFPGVAGVGVLHIQNSGVSSAVIRLNATEVVSPSTFNQQVKLLAVPVSLIEQNRIEVELRSKPGSSLSVQLTQSVEADGASVIGSAGGAVEITDPGSPAYGAVLVLPPGAVSDRRLFTISAAPSAPPFSDGHSGLSPLRIEPSGVTFAVPASLTLPYDSGLLDPETTLGEDTLSLFTFAGGEWRSLSTEPVDTLTRRVTSLSVDHLSYFALRDDTVVSGGPAQRDPTRLPVLLVHGWTLCSWGKGGTWGNLPALLQGEKLDVFEMNYDTGRPIEQNADILVRAVETVLQRAGERAGGPARAVNLITHSMGGLVARYAIQMRGLSNKVYQLATLATPHLGSPLALGASVYDALGGNCTSATQMAPCSQFLEGLFWDKAIGFLPNGFNGKTRAEAVPLLLSPGPDYHFFAANIDLLVAPESSALGTNWDHTCLAQPSALFTESTISRSEVVRERVSGCGIGGDMACDHTSICAGGVCLTDGIADVKSMDHVMWPKLRDFARFGCWSSDAMPPSCEQPPPPPPTGGWVQQFPAFSPPQMDRRIMAWDSAREEVFLQGAYPPLPPGMPPPTPHTWSWDGSDWTQRPAPTWGPGGNGIAVFDEGRRQLVVFQACGSNFCPGPSDLARTWVWDGSAWTLKWSLQLANPGSPEWALGNVEWAAMAHDAGTGNVVLFGGRYFSGQLPPDPYYRWQTLTWLWDGTSWRWVNPATRPPERYHHQMVYDVPRGEVLLFGGYGSGGGLTDAWAWNGSTWLQRSAAGTPRDLSAATFDYAIGRIVAYGCRNDGSPGTVVDEGLWNWNGSAWQKEPLSLLPPCRWSPELVFDQTRRELVLFGGDCVLSTGWCATQRYWNDTWVLPR